jgi:hypothetical protein
MHCSGTIPDFFSTKMYPYCPVTSPHLPQSVTNLSPEFLPYYFFTHPGHSINSTFFTTRFTLVVIFLTRVLAIEHFEKTCIVLWRCITPPIFASFHPHSSESHHTTRVWGDSSTTHVLSDISLGMHQFYGRLYTSKDRPILAEFTLCK